MMQYRNLTDSELACLHDNGCRSKHWDMVWVAEGFCADDMHNVYFEGEVHIGTGVKMRNVGVVRTTDGATYGQGVTISVKNEAGEGNVIIYPELSSQMAALMVRNDDNKPLLEKLRTMIHRQIQQNIPPCTTIGNGVTITDCRELTNVVIGDDCELCGVSRLVDCTLAPTPDASIYIGDDVIMENVIAQAGANVVDGAKVYDSFVGESCHIGRGFTSENSLFFANSHADNGEACAALCGPFSVTHHKSTLLIGGEYSFYNAGSATNFSNHAYKMGPIHYGTMERGAKTASGAHILWPAQIGAFSMVMGKVQTHPDTTLLPFSYVIGSGRETFVVPGRNLCTVGTYRDVMKWPKRDNRPRDARRSLVTFDWLSPYVIERVKAGKQLLEDMQKEQGYDVTEYRGDGFVVTASALMHGQQYYDLALRMYGNASDSTDWTDMLGLLAPDEAIQQIQEDIMSDDICDISTLEERFRDIYDSYAQWKGYSDNDNDMEDAVEEWKNAICRDAEKEYDMGDVSDEQLEEFTKSVHAM